MKRITLIITVLSIAGFIGSAMTIYLLNSSQSSSRSAGINRSIFNKPESIDTILLERKEVNGNTEMSIGESEKNEDSYQELLLNVSKSVNNTFQKRIDYSLGTQGFRLVQTNIKSDNKNKVSICSVPDLVDREPMYWQAVYPNTKFEPVYRLAFTFSLIRESDNMEITFYGEIHEPSQAGKRTAHYYACHSTFERMNSKAPMTKMQRQTFSGYTIGEMTWMNPEQVNSNNLTMPSSVLILHDDIIFLRSGIIVQPKEASAKQPKWPIISKTDKLMQEEILRNVLSLLYISIYDLNDNKNESTVINRVKLVGKRVSDKVLLVPIKSLAKQLNWKYEEKYGVLTINISKNKIIIPAGSRELIMGSRKEKLPLPVILDGKEFWVEKNALLRLIE